MPFRRAIAWLRSVLPWGTGGESRLSDLEPDTTSERAVKAPVNEIRVEDRNRKGDRNQVEDRNRVGDRNRKGDRNRMEDQNGKQTEEQGTQTKDQEPRVSDRNE